VRPVRPGGGIAVVRRVRGLDADAGGGVEAASAAAAPRRIGGGRRRRRRRRGGGDPEFLLGEFYHHTFVDAARFVSHVSSLATNVGHFPHLSVERVLATTDDAMTTMRDHDDDAREDGDDDATTMTADDDATTALDDPAATSTSSSKGGRGRMTKRAARHHRGWIVRSTVRCSTHRPPLPGRGRRSDDDDDDRRRRRSRRPPRGGLTYHDFHLALCIDVEAGRDEVRRLLLPPPSSRPRSDS